MQTYECLAVDTATKECTNWQAVEQPQTNNLPISKADADIFTMSIVGFMVFVCILREIKRFVN